MSDRTTVVLADDHAMMRDGIRSILENAESIEVVAEAENGREAVALASKHAPDVVLIDIGMPDLNGVEATRRIHTNDPKIAIIALSMHTTERYVMGMLDAGARGYLLKTCDSTELLRAIDAVQRGKVYVTADVTHVLLGRRQGDDRTGTPPPDVLTPREREVLQLIAEGLTSKEAASSVRRSRRSRPTAPTSFGSWTCTRSRS